MQSIQFERGLGQPPEPPAPVSRVDGQLHYYRYCLGGMWQWWEPAVLLARCHRVTRRVVAISESLVDGIIAAFHAGASAAGAATAATALAQRLPSMTETEIAALAAMHSPGPLFATSPFVIKDSYIQIGPCDERCQAGQVTIGPGAEGPFMQISGELFTLRRKGP